MNRRIVTVTLTVAMGLWAVGIAFAQAQEEVLDFVAPTPEFDRELQSELPLQGILNDSPIQVSQGSIAEAIPPLAAPSDNWLDVLRRRIRRAPRGQVALGAAAICAFFLTGWVVRTATRRRTRHIRDSSAQDPLTGSR